MSYATAAKKANVSTCSEVIHAEVEVEVFETPKDLTDIKFSTEAIGAIVEHPCLSTETVSTLEKPKIHTMQTVKVIFNADPTRLT